jgi:predicted transcriptional regulator
MNNIRQLPSLSSQRESFKQDAIRAWGHYQATGLHVTMEDADAWMAKLASGVDIEPPQPVRLMMNLTKL